MLRKRVLGILILISALNETFGSEIDDELCARQLFAFDEGMRAGEFWAIRLFDLWGKMAPGYLFGNRLSYGSFDACLNYTEATEQAGVVEGKYCLVSSVVAQPNSGMMLSEGVCLPAACSQEKILRFIKRSNMNEVTGARCQTKDPLPFDNFDIAAISLLSLVGLLMIVSTLYDLTARKSKDKEPNKIGIAFSVFTNGQQLFKIYKSKPSKTFDCLDGIRCISLMAVISAHRFLLELLGPTRNGQEIFERFNKFRQMLFFWSMYTVDTFLVIGGFLAAYQLLFMFKKKAFSAVPRMISRYIRYTPILVASIVIFTALARHVKGPYEDAEGTDKCRQYWWMTLLHIQNYVNPENLCAEHSWYLSIDFQLFVISPLLIYPAHLYGLRHLWNLLALAVLSALSVMMSIIHYDFAANGASGRSFWEVVMIQTHNRAAPWLIGMALACIFFEMREKEVKINKALELFLWVLSITAISACVVLMFELYKSINDLTVAEGGFIRGFTRLLWPLALAWIIFACHKLKSGGVLRWFLSLPQWQPLSRISLSMYIVSQFYQRLIMMSVRQPRTIELPTVFIAALGDILGLAVLSVFFTLAFDSPFNNILKYLNNRPQTKSYELSERKLQEAIRKGHDVAL